LTDGIYWELFDKINKNEGNFLKAFWGKVFHQYVISMLRKVNDIECHRRDTLYRELEGKPHTGSSQADLILYCSGKLMIFEITIRWLRIETILKADPELLKNELVSLLLERDPNRKKSSGKLLQISQTLECIKTGNYGNDLKRVAENAEIIPVVITLGNLNVSPLLGKIIEDIINNKRLPKYIQKIINSCIFLNIADIDTLLWAVEENITPLAELLSAYQSRRFSDYFTNYVQEFYKKDLWPSSEGKQAIAEIQKEADFIFFDKPI
jgi:hypothetical protein